MVKAFLPIDTVFLKRAAEQVMLHLDKNGFSGNELAEHLHLSREQTHRKLKKNTNLSTGKFIRYLRLLRAYHEVLLGDHSIAEISYRVGFDSPAYFNKCFKEEWGISPGEIKKNGHSYQLGKKPIYSFYQCPEIRKVLQENGVYLDFPTQGNGPPSRKKIWLIAGMLISLLVITASLLLSSTEKERPVIDLGDDSRIAVLPLTNQTGDSLMDQVGDIASSWISSQLDELESVQTVPYFTIKEYQPYAGILPNDPEGRPTLSEVVGARYFITGSYFIKEQKLFMDTRLLDAHTQECVYHLPIIEGTKDSVMRIIENLRLKIAGLVTNLEEVKLGKLTPPSYEAYKYYLNGLKEMSRGLYPSDALMYFEKATDLEPDFIMPQLYSTWFYYGDKRDSAIQKIAEIPNITDYEERMFKDHRLMFDHKYRELLQFDLQSLEDYPQDYYFNMMVAHRAKSQFMPHLALRVLSQLHDPFVSDIGLMWHYFKVRNYTESLMMLGRYEEALDYLQSIPDKLYNPAIPPHFIYVFVNLGRKQKEIEEFLDSLTPLDEKFRADYYTAAAYEFSLKGNDEASLYFARKASELMQALPDQSAYEFDMVDVLYLSNDLTGAKAYLKDRLQKNPNDDYLIYLGLIEAALGHEAEAKSIYAQLQDRNLIVWRRHNLEYQDDYLTARVYALRGQKKEAVELLESALEKGQFCHHYDFHRDIFLKPLFNYPPFQALVQPREYTDITAVP